MKHSIIITVIASLMLCLSLPTDAQRHRHHPGATTTTTKVDNKTTQKADPANAIEAFSDTTSAVADVDTTSTNATYTYDMDDDDWDESVRHIPFKLMSQIFSFGIWGIVIFLLISVFVFAIILLPLVLLALIVRWFIKRHNDDVARNANVQSFFNNMTANLPQIQQTILLRIILLSLLTVLQINKQQYLTLSQQRLLRLKLLFLSTIGQRA